MPKLNFGCGKTKLDGFEGVDKIDYGQEWVLDITKEWPSEWDNIIDEITARHFLEHLYPHELEEFFYRVKRILVKNGKMYFVVPHKDHERANVIQHRTFFTEYTFKELAKTYNFKITEIITNDRPDIHCKMINQ